MTIAHWINPGEQWRLIPDTDLMYWVSDLGNVFSGYMGGRLLAPYVSKPDGYVRVCLHINGRQASPKVYVLVLTAFAGPRPAGMEGCHNNGNKLDNRLENLRWDTHSANLLDAVDHGTHPQASKTHCKNGHEFTRENTLPNRGRNDWRRCRTCKLAGLRAWRARKRLAVPV